MIDTRSPAACLQAFTDLAGQISPARLKTLFKGAVIIVSSPRSGSTLLFEMLQNSPDFWTIGKESHVVFSAFPQLQAENAAFDSGCLGERHADKETAHLFRAGMLSFLVNRDGRRLLDIPRGRWPRSVRLLEKTPRNALNIPFLRKIFPDARFLYLHRDPRQNISSIMEAWNYPNFTTYRNLPGWSRGDWRLLLPPGWREMNGRSIAEIAAFQWRMSNQIILQDLSRLGAEKWKAVSYAEILGDPVQAMEKVCRFSGVRSGERMKQYVSGGIPLSSTTVSAPDPEKWKKFEKEIEAVLPYVDDVRARLADV